MDEIEKRIRALPKDDREALLDLLRSLEESYLEYLDSSAIRVSMKNCLASGGSRSSR